MAKFGPEIAAQIVAQATASLAEIASALTRTFDRPIEVAVGTPAPLPPGTSPTDPLLASAQGPGFAIVFKVQSSAGLLLIAESSGLLPAWYANPDPTGASKLATLAQELGMQLLPDEFMPDDSPAARVDDLSAALLRGEPAADAMLLPLALTSGELRGTALLVWPLAKAEAILVQPQAIETPAIETSAIEAPAIEVRPPAEIEPAADSKPGVEQNAAAESQPKPQPAAAPSTPTKKLQPVAPKTHTFRQLPNYTRSLLKIRVPLSVTLATKKQPVGQILELGPGSIIQFEKSCEEMLDLNVGNLAIARGEAVKVGEKFGLRVMSLTLPGERFKAVRAG